MREDWRSKENLFYFNKNGNKQFTKDNWVINSLRKESRGQILSSPDPNRNAKPLNLANTGTIIYNIMKCLTHKNNLTKKFKAGSNDYQKILQFSKQLQLS